jgi:small subunit ribosomal protein S4
LFLKGERCFTAKCAFEKRAYAPGDHGKSGSSRGGGERVSDYSRQLRAKQKVRRKYGVLERQFRRIYGIAVRQSGLTGLNLLQLLETRLDNVVYRMGYAENRAQARQMVTHGHFKVNGIPSDIPSMILNPGDEISVRENSIKKTLFKDLAEVADKRICPLWLDRNTSVLSGKVVRLPERSEIDGNVNEQLIVEFYSR